MAEEIFLRLGAARQLLVDKFGLHRLFFGQGAAEIPHTRENLLSPSPPPTTRLRNQSGPGAETHRATQRFAC